MIMVMAVKVDPKNTSHHDIRPDILGSDSVTVDKTLSSNKSHQAQIKRRKPPLVLRWLRFSFRVQSLVSSRWAGWHLFKLWFTSPKHPEPKREQHWREDAQFISIPHLYGPIATYKWGNSQNTILLLHGWSGRGPQMGAFVAPLLERGYQVIAFDAPGHGRTPGTTSSVFKMSDALHAVIKEVGPINAVIAHSFGCILLAYALKHTDFKTDKAICISSPTTPLFLVDRFCSFMRINDKVKQHFMRYTEAKFNNDVWDKLSADKNVQGMSLPALIIHDEDDHDVPCQLGQQLAEAWPDSHLHLTKGLGHRRILRNKHVIQAVTDFLD